MDIWLWGLVSHSVAMGGIDRPWPLVNAVVDARCMLESCSLGEGRRYLFELEESDISETGGKPACCWGPERGLRLSCELEKS